MIFTFFGKMGLDIDDLNMWDTEHIWEKNSSKSDILKMYSDGLLLIVIVF